MSKLLLSADYLRQVKEKIGASSDAAVGKELGVNEDTARKYRTGERAPDAWACLQIARVLDRPIEEIIAAAEIDRARKPAQVREWKVILKKSRSAVASVSATVGILSALLSGAPPNSYASTKFNCGTSYANPLYALCEAGNSRAEPK